MAVEWSATSKKQLFKVTFVTRASGNPNEDFWGNYVLAIPVPFNIHRPYSYDLRLWRRRRWRGNPGTSNNGSQHYGPTHKPDGRGWPAGHLRSGSFWNRTSHLSVVEEWRGDRWGNLGQLHDSDDRAWR